MQWLDELQIQLGAPVLALAQQYWLVVVAAGVIAVPWLVFDADERARFFNRQGDGAGSGGDHDGEAGGDGGGD